MKKLTIIATLASLAFALPLSATTVQFSAAGSTTSRQAVLADGSTLVSDPNNLSSGNNLVLLGSFSAVNNFTFNPALSVQQNFNNMLTVGDGGFSQFGLAQPGNGASESTTYTLTLTTTGVLPKSQVSGQISDESTPQTGINASFFDGKQVYIVIVNGTTIAAASQMGIFTSSSWAYPTNTGSALTDTSSFATSTGTTVNAVGGAGAVITSPTNALELAAASAAPEPSTLVSLLGAGGLLALLRRRRVA
jgi:hypothetical protein